MTDPRIIIVGPGAMGCGMAALLKDRGANVALLDHRQDRAAQIARGGLRVEVEGRRVVARVPCSAEAAEVGVGDLVIILVKAYATREAAAHAAACVGPETAVLTLQNGLGNYEALAEALPRERVLAGTIVMGCASTGVGAVRISGMGEVVVGSPFGNEALAARTAEQLGRYWPRVRHTADVEAALWRKVIINAAVNPLTALTVLSNGALLEDAGLRETMAAISREAALVAYVTGARPFEGEDPVAAVEEVCRVTAGNRSSMLQDVAAGRRTEIEQICGEIVRRGKAAKIQTPLCQALAAMVGARSANPFRRE